jgi:methyltransferase (TIGR00027 family)
MGSDLGASRAAASLYAGRAASGHRRRARHHAEAMQPRQRLWSEQRLSAPKSNGSVQTGPQSTRERKKSLLGVEDRATEAVSGKQRRLLPGTLGLAVLVFFASRGLWRWGSRRRQRRRAGREGAEARSHERRRSSQGEISVVEPAPVTAPSLPELPQRDPLSMLVEATAQDVDASALHVSSHEEPPVSAQPAPPAPEPKLPSKARLPVTNSEKRNPGVVSAFLSLGRIVTGGASNRAHRQNERAKTTKAADRAETATPVSEKNASAAAVESAAAPVARDAERLPTVELAGVIAEDARSCPAATNENATTGSVPGESEVSNGSRASNASTDANTKAAGERPPLAQVPQSATESRSGPQLRIQSAHPLYNMVRASQLLAAARALELELYGEQALVRDIFAEKLAGARFMAAQRERARTSTTDQLSRIPVRTRYFDDFLMRCLFGKEQGSASNEPPPRQVVILGAGLDMRAYRLDIPRDTVVYELDMPVVLEYKLRILRNDFPSYKPKSLVKYVPSDLTKDWKQDLLAAGFDPGNSSVWLLEGLTYYLPESLCRALFSDMRSLMPVGRASWTGASFVQEALVRKLQARTASTPRMSEESTEETLQSGELPQRPGLEAHSSRKRATPSNNHKQSENSHTRQTLVFGTDDPEGFLKSFGLYTTTIVYLGEKGANYGRFAKPFRHTMYVIAFAG